MLFIEDGAPVIVQGMTGHQGMTHTAPCSRPAPISSA